MTVKIESFETQKRLFDTAALLVRGGKLDEAITLYDYLVIQNPAVPQFWTAGGIAKMKRGYHDEACAHFQIAEAAEESNPVPVLMRGICLMRMGKRIEALVALKRAHMLARDVEKDGWMASMIERTLGACSAADGRERHGD
jgi:tetratricopeptide (TPR) repeat protein